ncbi:MAG: pro-sigmaK processing inhibitor BofA family protein [Bacilli bacterium]|nr:pro-sigmaK processing inhibitor BofA family protein [Bacilli bacterium]
MISIFRLIKRIILSCLVLYTYNLLAVSINMVIPINIFTIGTISFLGVPGFFVMIILKAFMF